MGLWSYDSPPTFRPDAVASNAGWCHPVTGEVLACYPGLLDIRREMLDHLYSNFRLEAGDLFLLERVNSDSTVNFLILE